jgi:hypothetical protein
LIGVGQNPQHGVLEFDAIIKAADPFGAPSLAVAQFPTLTIRNIVLINANGAPASVGFTGLRPYCAVVDIY